MKKIFYTILSVILIFSFTALQSCKEDTTPPTITVNGSLDTTIAKGSAYEDPGATAEDDKDDAVYVLTDFSTSNPDETVPRAYTITYKAQDRNANIAIATRTVNVTWTGGQIDFSYIVNDTSALDTIIGYTVTVSPDIINPYLVYINNLGNGVIFTGTLYGILKANTVTIPTQTLPGTLGSAYKVGGSGTINDISAVITWSLYYHVQDTTTGSPTLNRHAIFAY